MGQLQSRWQRPGLDTSVGDLLRRVGILERKPASPGVDSIDGGGGPLTGDVTFSAGGGITLTQAGQNIEIESTTTAVYINGNTSIFSLFGTITRNYYSNYYRHSYFNLQSGEIELNTLGATLISRTDASGTWKRLVVPAGVYEINYHATLIFPQQTCTREINLTTEGKKSSDDSTLFYWIHAPDFAALRTTGTGVDQPIPVSVNASFAVDEELQISFGVQEDYFVGGGSGPQVLSNDRRINLAVVRIGDA